MCKRMGETPAANGPNVLTKYLRRSNKKQAEYYLDYNIAILTSITDFNSLLNISRD